MNYFPNNVMIGLLEMPTIVSFIIPRAGCGHHCDGCHSPEWQNPNNGVTLDSQTYMDILKKYREKVSCVCFFGGEHAEMQLSFYMEYAKVMGYKVALYSGYGLVDIPPSILEILDYIKVGAYNKKLGGLDDRRTNQRMFKRTDEGWGDITNEFWRE